MNEWLTALAIVTPLVGVWLGRYIEGRARRESRDRVESFEFRKDASRILGKAGLTLRTMDPLDYAALAVLPTIELRIVTRTKEANEIRPELSELAVRWPEAAGELTVIEKHLGHAPTQLSMVVKGALALPDDEEPFKAAFSSAGESFDEASAAFERVLELLDSKG